MKLDEIVHELDREFDIERFGRDPGFSRFLPYAYELVDFKWKHAFEKEISTLFNGLMLKGAAEVKKEFLAVFPSDEILDHFIMHSEEGDLLFMHHPLLMECGDPHGEWGKGFVPIKEHHIHRMKENRLSVYTCHEPMDFHKELGTTVAIEHALGLTV
jgi:putative NIF3 family GTP cyclohydrolase 1 type 2